MSVFAIADIHGCVNTFKELLHVKLRLKRNDTLYLLGDYINKGPDSKGVLDHLIYLKDNGFNLHCLRGNHDQMLLDAIQLNSDELWCTDLQKNNTLKSFNVNHPLDVPMKYIQLLKSMDYFFQIENYYLVHAGFNIKTIDPFKDTLSMLNIKDFIIPKSGLNGKSIIHGHVPQKNDTIPKKFLQKEKILKIDGGCVYYKNKEYGNLLALDIQKLEIITQVNIDFPYNINVKI